MINVFLREHSTTSPRPEHTNRSVRLDVQRGPVPTVHRSHLRHVVKVASRTVLLHGSTMVVKFRNYLHCHRGSTCAIRAIHEWSMTNYGKSCLMHRCNDPNLHVTRTSILRRTPHRQSMLVSTLPTARMSHVPCHFGTSTRTTPMLIQVLVGGTTPPTCLRLICSTDLKSRCVRWIPGRSVRQVVRIVVSPDHRRCSTVVHRCLLLPYQWSLVTPVTLETLEILETQGKYQSVHYPVQTIRTTLGLPVPAPNLTYHLTVLPLRVSGTNLGIHVLVIPTTLSTTLMFVRLL